MQLAHHAMTWEGWWKQSQKQGTLEELFGELREAGYDAVEIGLNESQFGNAATVRGKAAAAGVRVVAVAASVTANPWPPNTDQYRREMDYAAELGVSIITVCGGFLGYRRTTFSSDYQLFADNLSRACDYAAKNSQTVAFHPHLGCIVETIAETNSLLQFAPDSLKLCLDTGHLIGAGDQPTEFIRQFGPRVAHVHLKDRDIANNHFTELGVGNAGLVFPEIFAELARAKYSGWLVVERDSPTMPASVSAASSLRFIRQSGITGHTS